jgi:hypothetical protein
MNIDLTQEEIEWLKRICFRALKLTSMGLQLQIGDIKTVDIILEKFKKAETENDNTNKS